MNDVPEPAASSYTTIQPSGGSYKNSSLKEGFICAGIWALAAASLVAGPRLWAEHAHPENGALSVEDWTNFIAALLGQFVVMAVVFSSVVFYRRKANVTSFILADWRWWLACVIIGGLQSKNVLPWLWVTGIYQIRLGMKPKFRPATSTQTS
jgi:hypothetical protein